MLAVCLLYAFFAISFCGREPHFGAKTSPLKFYYTVKYKEKSRNFFHEIDELFIDNDRWYYNRANKFTPRKSASVKVLKISEINEMLKTAWEDEKPIKIKTKGKFIEVYNTVSYHVIKGAPLSQHSWQDIKDKAGADIKYGGNFARFYTKYDYTKLFNFLKDLDKDINYFVGLTIVNKVIKTAYGKRIKYPKKQMPLIKAAIRLCDAGKTYYLRWHNGQIKVDENKDAKITNSQAIIEYRGSTLKTFEFFSWIHDPWEQKGAEFNGDLTTIQQVLGMKYDKGKKFNLLKADGTELKVGSKNCFITFTDAEIQKIKKEVRQKGFSAELIDIEGTVSVPGEKDQKVKVLVRPMDSAKKIYYCGPVEDKKEIIAYQIYSNINNMMKTKMWSLYASQTNNHEYVFNLFEFEMIHPLNLDMGCPSAYLFHDKKGLVIINGNKAELNIMYYNGTHKYWPLHARNLQRFFKPLNKIWYGDAAKYKKVPKIEAWLAKAGKSLFIPTDLFTNDDDFIAGRKWYEDPYKMSKDEINPDLAARAEVKLKQFVDRDPDKYNLHEPKSRIVDKPFFKSNTMYIYPSKHSENIVQAQDIVATMKKKEPKCVIVEMDTKRVHNGHIDVESKLDMPLTIATAISNDFTEVLVYGDVPFYAYLPWMFSENPFGEDTIPNHFTYTNKKMYFSILLNARNHLFINIALKLMEKYPFYTKDPIWFDVGFYHLISRRGLGFDQPKVVMSDLLSFNYDKLGKSFRFYGDDKVSFRFDLWPYVVEKNKEHMFAAERMEDDIMESNVMSGGYQTKYDNKYPKSYGYSEIDNDITNEYENEYEMYGHGLSLRDSYIENQQSYTLNNSMEILLLISLLFVGLCLVGIIVFVFVFGCFGFGASYLFIKYQQNSGHKVVNNELYENEEKV
eukprot:537529_1